MRPIATDRDPPDSHAIRHQMWLLAGLFSVAYGTNVSTPLLVLYRDRLGLGDGRTMAIFVAYVGGILITLLLAGPLSDRIGRRAVCVPSMVLAAVASVVLVLGRDQFALLLVGRALLGAASGAFMGVGAAWIQEVMGRGTELRAAAVTTMTAFVGFGAGPMSSAVMERLFPWPLVLPLLVHTTLVAMVLPGVLTVPETRATRTPQVSAPSRPPMTRRDRRLIELGVPSGRGRDFALVLAPVAFWVFAFPSNSFALFPVLLRDSTEGFEVLVAGLSAAFTAWSALLSRPVLARLGARPALPVAMAAGVVGLLLGAVSFATESWPPLLPAAVLLGACSGTLMAGGLTITSELAEDASRGAFTSTFYVGAYVGMAMPLVVTSLSEIWSTSTVLFAITLVATASGLVVSRSVRTMKPVDPSPALPVSPPMVPPAAG